jgi:hypothetical protein
MLLSDCHDDHSLSAHAPLRQVLSLPPYEACGGGDVDNGNDDDGGNNGDDGGAAA